MTWTKIVPETEPFHCSRCGIELNPNAVNKRVKRKIENPDWCYDCRDTRTTIRQDHKWVHPVLGEIYCWIWDGELNDDWLPIDDNGDLYRPGERICGLKDCVKLPHIIEPEKKTVTDIDLILGMHEMQQYNKRAKAN